MDRGGAGSGGGRRAICGICPAGCWVKVGYDDQGRLARVAPDRGTPMGITCKLGEAAPEIVYSEHRLQTPLRRVGPRGGFDFEPLSWDEALDQVAGAIQATARDAGPQANCIYTGRGSFELAMCDVFQPKGTAVSSASSLLFPLGSPNTMGVGALCYVSYAMIAPHVTYGGMLVNTFSDIEQAELIVVWGANPATDCPPLDLKRILEARARGAEVVVIDPRRTATARLAEADWVPIRPGTDGALALGLCQVIIAEELHDEAFVRDWTLGFEEFARYVQHFRPSVVESMTGVPAETVKSLARRIAAARGAAPVMYTGLEYSDGGVQAIRATMVLWALAGQLDVPGGRCFSMPGNSFDMNRRHHLANPDVRRAVGRDSFPVYSHYRGESHANALPDAVLKGEPYPIKTLLIHGASLTTSWPEPQVWRDTLNALDFLAVIDTNLTADCAYADIVLPACTMFEIQSYMRYGPTFRIRERVIPPVGQARNGFLIWAAIAERLGYGHLYPQSEEAILAHALEGSGFSVDQVRAAGGMVTKPTQMMQYRKWESGLLRDDGEPGFATPSGKVEIASSVLEEFGYDPLPRYLEPAESPQAAPEVAGDYPLVFMGGSRTTTDFRTQFHHVPSLVRERPEPTAMINDQDAAARGIADGDMITLASPRGSLTLRAQVTADIAPGCVDANYGGGGPLGPKAWREANLNELTPLRFDPISGFPIYKALLCQVALAQAGAGRSAAPAGVGEAQAVEVRAARAGRRVYLDANATTRVHPAVRAAMAPFLEDEYGNPSAIHRPGRQARAAVEDARRKVAGLVGTTPRRIVFTGGGSEANNLVLKGVLLGRSNGRRRVITSAIEHPSVLGTVAWLEEMGYPVTRLPVDATGRVRPSDLAAALGPDVALVSIMAANNETGSLQPLKELSELAHAAGALMHSDAVQAAGKVPLDVAAWGVDYLTLSGHKFHGPKGIGALYAAKGAPLTPLIHGGGQEAGLRAGTENTPGIVGLGAAADLAGRRLEEMASRVAGLRDRLWEGIRELMPEARLNGHPSERLPNTLSCSLPGLRGESLVVQLDHRGVALSSGSACRAGSAKPSHALLAMGLTEAEAHCALRWSLALDNDREEIDQALAALAEVLASAREAVRFTPCR